MRWCDVVTLLCVPWLVCAPQSRVCHVAPGGTLPTDGGGPWAWIVRRWAPRPGGGGWLLGGRKNAGSGGHMKKKHMLPFFLVCTLCNPVQDLCDFRRKKIVITRLVSKIDKHIWRTFFEEVVVVI